MKPVKQIQFDFYTLEDLLSNLYTYWMATAQNPNVSREEFYRAYLVKRFYERTRKRQTAMIEMNRKTIKVKFDVVHAVLLTDVLQRTMANKTTLDVLFQLGSMCPAQMQKV